MGALLLSTNFFFRSSKSSFSALVTKLERLFCTLPASQERSYISVKTLYVQTVEQDSLHPQFS